MSTPFSAIPDFRFASLSICHISLEKLWKFNSQFVTIWMTNSINFVLILFRFCSSFVLILLPFCCKFVANLLLICFCKPI